MAITIKTLEALNVRAFLVYDRVGKSGGLLRPTRCKTLTATHLPLDASTALTLLLSPSGNIIIIHPKEKHGNSYTNDWDFLNKLNEYNYPGVDILLRQKLVEITLRDLRNATNH